MTRGHVRRRGAGWEWIAELGDQPSRRCTDCGRRRWGTDPAACSRCGGVMGDVALERRQASKAGFPRRRDAQEALTSALAGVDGGRYVTPSDLTVAGFLDEWLPTARLRLRPGAYDAVALHVRRYIAPRIGVLPLADLTGTRVRGLYAELAESGRVRGRGGLSRKTVHNVHVTLRRALADAVADGLLARNPADGTHVAPASPAQPVWTGGQLAAFLAHVLEVDPRAWPMWRTLAYTGLRRGELVGLRWVDVDVDAARVSVARQRAKGGGIVAEATPKTARSRRLVDIDAGTVDALRRRRVDQVADRLAAGPAWADQGLVFCAPHGAPVHPDSVTKRMRRLVSAAGLPALSPHGLRHTHATLLLEAGVHPKVVQERLGHSSIAVTLDIYSHVTPGLQRDAAAAFARAVETG